MNTKKPLQTPEEELAEVREELARTQRILRATQNAVRFWVRRYLKATGFLR